MAVAQGNIQVIQSKVADVTANSAEVDAKLAEVKSQSNVTSETQLRKQHQFLYDKVIKKASIKDAYYQNCAQLSESHRNNLLQLQDLDKQIRDASRPQSIQRPGGREANMMISEKSEKPPSHPPISDIQKDISNQSASMAFLSSKIDAEPHRTETNLRFVEQGSLLRRSIKNRSHLADIRKMTPYQNDQAEVLSVNNPPETLLFDSVQQSH